MGMYQISTEKQKEMFTFIDGFYSYFSKEDQFVFKSFKEGNVLFSTALLEIYTYCNAVAKEVNFYYAYYLDLKQKFPNLSEMKILEVASGYIPAFSYFLTQLEVMKQPITAMDPLTLPLTYENVITKKECFTKNTSISSYDLIVAMCPCEAIQPLLDKIVEEKKPLFVQVCSCLERNKKHAKTRLEWLDYLNFLTEKLFVLEKDGYMVEKKYNTLSYLLDAPAYYVRKKTREFHQ